MLVLNYKTVFQPRYFYIKAFALLSQHTVFKSRMPGYHQRNIEALFAVKAAQVCDVILDKMKRRGKIQFSKSGLFTCMVIFFSTQAGIVQRFIITFMHILHRIVMNVPL